MENLVFEASKRFIEDGARQCGVDGFVYTLEQDQKAQSDAETFGVGVVLADEHIPVAFIYTDASEDDGGGPVIAALCNDMIAGRS